MGRRIIEDIWATNGGRITIPSVSRFENGWEGDPEMPDAKIQNYLENLTTEFLDNLSKNGMLEWIATETYPENGYCKHQGRLYRSLKNSNLNKNPPSELDWWFDESFGFVSDHFIEGLSAISNAINPLTQIDVLSGKCLAKDKQTSLSIPSITIADLTNHITPLANTTYYCFIYYKTNGTISLDFATILAPTPGTNPNQLPDLDGTKYRRVIGVFTDSSGNILNFWSFSLGQYLIVIYNPRNRLQWSGGTVADILIPIEIPSGLSLICNFTARAVSLNNTVREMSVYSPNELPPVVRQWRCGVAGAATTDHSGVFNNVISNEASQVRIDTSGGTKTLYLNDYIDPRLK